MMTLRCYRSICEHTLILEQRRLLNYCPEPKKPLQPMPETISKWEGKLIGAVEKQMGEKLCRSDEKSSSPPHMGEPSSILGGGPYRLFETMKAVSDGNSVVDHSRNALILTSQAKEILYGLANLRGRLGSAHIEAVLNSELRTAVFYHFADHEVITETDFADVGSDRINLLHEACFEALTQDAPVVKEYEVEQDFGPYIIAVLGVPGAYFISALERDPIGPFSSIEAAHNGVLFNFDGLLTEGETANLMG